MLTGLSTATNTAIAAADSVLIALGKLQAQLNLNVNFATVAALRANTAVRAAASQAHVLGFSAIADGGEGLFNLNPADTTSADNGGTILVDGAGQRWYRQRGGNAINLLWFGGAGLSDFSPALNSALALAGTMRPGAEIFIPAGSFNFNSLVSFTYPASTPFGLTIRGAGADITVLNWPSTSGLSFSMSIPQHTIHMLDMTVASGAAGTGNGIACAQSSPQGIFGQNDFTRLTLRGSDGVNLGNYWNNAIAINGLGNINFDGLLVYGHPVSGSSSAGNGVIISGLTSGTNIFAIVYNFTDCSFWELGTCIEYGTNLQGMSINACNFTNSTNGILQPGGAVGGAQLSVVNSQFNCFGNAIIQAGALNNISVSNSLFLLAVANGSAIALAGSGAEHTFTGNVFSTFAAPLAGSNGINVAAANQIATITGNTFVGFVSGINLGGATNFYVQGNRYVNCSNTVANIGSNTVGVAAQ